MAATSDQLAERERPAVIDSPARAEQLIGVDLGESEPELIDQERIDRFAAVTGDHQWIHVDVDRAKRTPLGGTIAHGHLILSLIPLFATRLFSIEFGTARLNYGSNRVRFISPVPAGATVRGSATIISVHEEPHGTTITTQFTIRADGTSRPACIAEAITFVQAETVDVHQSNATTAEGE